MINFNSNTFDKLYFDNTEIQKVYYENEIVYMSGTPVYHYDISTMVDLVSEVKTTKYENPQDFQWSLDGLTFWELGISSTDGITEFSVSVPFDLSSTITEIYQLNLESSTGSKVSTLTGFDWSADGTIIATIDYSGRTVNKYICSTAFDISTASWSWESTTFSLHGHAIRFINNGSQLLLNLESTTKVYDLGTDYDPSTINYTEVQSWSGPVGGGGLSGWCFNSDGSQVIIADEDNQDLYSYDLPTPWNITTMTNKTTFSIPAWVYEFVEAYVSPNVSDKIWLVANGELKTYSIDLE